MSDESDIEIQTKISKKPTSKLATSITEEILKTKGVPKKLTTKEMVHYALVDLNNRKGTSFYAIKKYIREKFEVDADKISYIIKKVLKTEAEAGKIVQIKGTGASGSFKLIDIKKKTTEKKAITKGSRKKTTEPAEDTAKKTKKIKSQPIKPKEDNKEVENKEKVKGKAVENKKEEKKEPKVPKSAKTKVMKTPAKKRAAMLKRKSIGSIIKPPKMRPKANV